MSTIRHSKIELLATIEKRLGVSLFGILLVCCFLYIYFLGSVIFDVVARKNAETAIRLAEATVSSLELDYFKASDKVTLEHALSIGFVEDTKTIFASRTDRTARALPLRAGGEL